MFCSIDITATQLAVVAATLANDGVCPTTGRRIFQRGTVRNCLSLMATCGLYDYSGEFAFTMGFPSKSGVAGALMIVIPNVAVACAGACSSYPVACAWRPSLSSTSTSTCCGARRHRESARGRRGWTASATRCAVWRFAVSSSMPTAFTCTIASSEAVRVLPHRRPCHCRERSSLARHHAATVLAFHRPPVSLVSPAVRGRRGGGGVLHASSGLKRSLRGGDPRDELPGDSDVHLRYSAARGHLDRVRGPPA